MSAEDQSRSEFEAHMLSLNMCTRLHRQREELGGRYRTTTVQRAWDLWQASRRTYRASVLEEAAEACENVDPAIYRFGGQMHDDAAGTRRACIDAIRALAAKTQEGQEP